MRHSRTRVVPHPVRPFPLRYGMSFALTLWVVVILLPLGDISKHQPFGILMSAVALSAWYGGMGPGLVSALAGAIFAVYQTPSMGIITLGLSSEPFLQVTSYLVAALSIGALADRRDKAEGQVRTSLDEQQAILSCVADCICAVDSTGEILYSNEAAEKMAGPLEALLGFAPDAAYEVLDEHRSPVPARQRPVQRVFASLQAADAMVCARERASGVERWYVVRARAMSEPSNRVRVAVCIVYDVTSIKNAEAERARLLAAEQAARRSAEHSASRLMSLNRVSTELSRAMTTEQVAAVVLREGVVAMDSNLGLLVMTSEDGKNLRLVCQQVTAPGTSLDWDHLPLDVPTPITDSWNNRDIVWLESSEQMHERYPWVLWHVDEDRARVAVPLCLDDRCLGALYIILNESRPCSDEDRTFLWALSQQCAQALERSRLYEVERRAREEAERSAHALDEFLAMLSHELRNPLNSVVSATALLQHLCARDTELSEPLDVLQMETRQITRLVNDLLDISRITRGKITLRPVPTDLMQVVHRALHGVRPQMEERRQDLQIRGPQSGDGLCAMVDPARMEQVIGNLLSNASKYSDPGASIDLSLERDGDSVVLRVRDEGIGIAPDFLPHVFELFQQADRSLDRSGGGLGIGLTLVQRLVAMHGGSVSVASDGIGRGCEFVVRLPLVSHVEVRPVEPTSTPGLPV